MHHDWSPAVGPYPAPRPPAPGPLAGRPSRRSRYIHHIGLGAFLLFVAWFGVPYLVHKVQWQRAQAIRQAHHWRAAFALPLQQRVGPADPLLTEFARLDSKRAGWPLLPHSYTPDAAFRRDLDTAIADLPPEVTRAAAAKLAGIYLVANANYSGITYEIVDATGEPAQGVILINAANFEHYNANQWLTWKENTPFEAGSRWDLRVEIERPAENTRARALEFLLLHELGHLLAIGTNIGPRIWNVRETRFPPVADYPFVSLSWRDSRDAAFESRNEESFPMRHKVYYYWEPPLNGNEMEPIYRNLQQTNFATLYGATNPWDDFAEAFATYVHTRMQHRPYKIVISRDNRPALVYHSCWEEGRCEEKRKYMEQVLGIGRGAAAPLAAKQGA